MISKEKILEINDIVLGIYQCGSEDVFTYVCKELKKHIKFKYSLTSFSSHINRKFDSFNYRSIDMDTKDIQDYVDYYEKLDFCAWYNAQPKRAVYKNAEMIHPAALEASVLYTDWMKPLGVYYSLFASCFANNINYGVITFMRSKSMGDFTEEEVFILSIINDHVSQRFTQLYPMGINRIALDKKSNSLCVKYNLTNREFEIIKLLKLGVYRSEIVKLLFISENTLKKHMSNIYHKLGICSEAQLYQLINEAFD